MDFAQRLVTLRKQRGLTQRALAEMVGIQAPQLRRYESGAAQPGLDIARRLAKALSVSADGLLFDEHERGPDEELRLQFEAIAAFSPEEKRVAKAVLDSLILQHQARRWSTMPPGPG